MKKTQITVWKISKDEAKQLKELTPVLIFNEKSKLFNVELAGHNAIYNKIHCSEYNIFYALTEPNFNKEEKSED